MIKTLYFIFFVCLSANIANAQMISNYRDVLEDSTEFVHLLGSVKEYNYQNSIIHSNKKNFKRSFIHAKVYYATEIIEYLIKEGICGKEIEISESDDYVDFINVGCPGMQTAKTKQLTVRCYVDMDNRIKSVRITGEIEMLVNLFIGYWEDGRIKRDAISKNNIVFTDVLDDRVLFNWEGGQPMIRINQNPNIKAYKNNVIE